jgi:hypothetical protein
MINNKKFRVVDVAFGRGTLRKWSEVPQCYVCDQPAPAWPWPDGPVAMACGAALINDDGPVPLCEACFVAGRTTVNSIVRKFLNAPDLEIADGGHVSTTRVIAAKELN